MPDPESAPERSSRPFDVVLFGATGYTGRLVAAYLAGRRPAGFAWALAGRNRSALEAVREDLARKDPALASLETIVADASDPASLSGLARRARVVCTTVGPYAKLGLPLVAACAEAGTDYCDLTGEVPFMRASIDAHHARASETGARIVHACGFDSIPSDLGVFLLHEHFRGRGRALAKASFFCGPMKGGLSGGTIASMMNFLEEASKDRELLRLAKDPYALAPDRAKDRGPDGPDQKGVHFDARLREWTGPFVMAPVNTRVVRRTNAILGYPYGRAFRYAEASSYGPGPKGLARAALTTTGLGAFALLASDPRGRRLVRPRLPAPGEGPSEATREAGHFRVRILGESEARASGAPLRATALILGTSDPGYGETAKMLAESALCLLERAPGPGPEAGVLTPAAAMGTRLVERLRAAGMTFRVEAEA